MSRFNILTQHPVTIDLSRPAMEYIIGALSEYQKPTVEYGMECELDNFCNLLQNLLERSEPETQNFDLIGD